MPFVRLNLEQLEDRTLSSAAPWGFNVTEIQAPANIAATAGSLTPFANAMLDANILLWLGQFHIAGLGLPYEDSTQVIRYDINDQQWHALFGNMPPTCGHWVATLPGGGSIGLLFCPTSSIPVGVQQFTGGEYFDLGCLYFGFDTSDPTAADFAVGHLYDFNYILHPPAAPRQGPNFWVSDILCAQGNPLFVLFI